jgi:hypothetical protein
MGCSFLDGNANIYLAISASWISTLIFIFSVSYNDLKGDGIYEIEKYKNFGNEGGGC